MIVYGLIGYPLSHSFSAKYFTEKFSEENLKDHFYQLFPLPDLTDLPKILKTPGLAGLNVTIPYKQAIIPYLDKLDQKAEKTGAVNTIQIIRKTNNLASLTGYNTDIEGFLNSADFSGHKKALVLGTGGASSAVRYALKSLGISCIPVSRQPHPFTHVLYQDLTGEIMQENTLIVNATPVGMFPDVNAFPPIPYEHLTEKHFLYDLVYNPEMTIFLERGKERGARIMNGLRMLHLQAELSWEIWKDD